MRLAELLKDLLVTPVQGDLQQEVTAVISSYTHNFAVEGPLPKSNAVLWIHLGPLLPDDVRRYLHNNVRMLVIDRMFEIPAAITVIQAVNCFEIFAQSAARLADYPAGKMTLVGVTGTAGKTTVTHLIDAMLRASGLRTAHFGTLGHVIDGEVQPQTGKAASLTTPYPDTLNQLLLKCRKAGVTHVTLEVSSHALFERRVDGCDFDIGIFTNFSPEHLNYHLNAAHYFDSKRRLFFHHLVHSQKDRRFACINGDDPFGKKILRGLKKTKLTALGFGRKKSALNDIHALKVQMNEKGTRADIIFPDGRVPINSALLGAFNLENILAACTVAHALGLGRKFIIQGIKTCRRIPGRLERIPNRLGIKAYFDWAHSIRGYEAILSQLKSWKGRGKLAVIMGLESDAALNKQKGIFKTVAHFADFLYLSVETVNRTGRETIVSALQNIFKGKKARFEVFSDPLDSLSAAVRRARKGDTLVAIGWEIELVEKGEGFLNSLARKDR